MALTDVSEPGANGGFAELATRQQSMVYIVIAALATATAFAGALGWLLLSPALSVTPRAPDAYAQSVAPLSVLPGRLEIDSTPPGATVRVGDQELGETPLVVEAFAPGRHRIAITVPDYERWDGHIDVTGGGTATQRVTLQPLPARLAVASAGEAAVWIDDHLRGYAPVELTVDPGEHLIRVEAEGYRVWERRIALRPNESRTVNLSLQQPWPDPAKAPLRVLGVMIENQEQARPQAGLDRASVVYEALAEGGITRFLALYATHDAEVVGPVRSARHYYVNWAQEFNAPLVHVGASPLGYDALTATKTASLDEIRGAPGFWRSPVRPAPHNLYANLAEANEILDHRGVAPEGSFGGLQFKRAATRLDGDPVRHALIRFGSWAYSAEWHYDPYWNEYTRSMDGAPHVDAGSGEQIRATNVILQSMESWLIEHDREGRLDFAQVGKGSIVALTDGIAVRGTWSKAPNQPTEYRDTSGAQLRLNPGPTWIQIVPADGSVALDAE